VIMGGDADPKAVEAARANIAEAGLSDWIQVAQRRLLDWPAEAQALPPMGLLVCNPPYGERMGDAGSLPRLYENLGDIMRESLPGWRSAIITDKPQLGKFTGLTLFESVPFDNGPIECEVLFYRASKAVTQSRQPEATPEHIISDTAPDLQEFEISEQGDMFANRLKKNIKHLAKWARKNKVSCYRIYDADLPDYALAIDLYDDQVHVQEYAPPKQIDPQKAVERLKEAMHIIPDVLEVPANSVSLKVRQKQRGSSQYEAQAAQNKRFEVEENGLKFWVNLRDYLDTGLFLDHRDTRLMLMNMARGKDFLNLFSYTGSVTVYAAAGGASSTTSVDMSNTYLGWARDNLELNELDGEQHRFIRANCLEWLQAAQQEAERFDLIFLDPPTFSNSSRMEGVFDVQRDHVSLIQMAANLLKPGGQLIFSTNRRDFKMALDLMEGLSLKDISAQTIPKDFERNKKIHQCWLVTKKI